MSVCCQDHREIIEELEAANYVLIDALDEIVNRDVYSYLPRKEGVQIKVSFDDLESIRNLIKQARGE